MTPDAIKLLRQKLGLSQEQFAAQIGVSFGTVNRWERGRTKPLRVHAQVLQKWMQDAASATGVQEPRPVFGTLHGVVTVPEDKYLLNEPADVRQIVYGPEYL